VSAPDIAPEITVASPGDREPVVRTLVAAFTHDPVLRFLFPADRDYPDHAAAFFGHLFDKRVERSSIWTIAGGASVAVWEPPVGSTAAAGTAAAGTGLHSLPADALARVQAYDDAVHAALPTPPFWYLGVLGTHPDRAGRRWGRALLRTGLERAAADGLPAVLETSNPVNVEVYRRAGFQVIGHRARPFPFWVMEHPAAVSEPTGAAATGA